MPYAILQQQLTPPSLEQLRQAFRALPQLVDADATFIEKGAFGILVERLSMADAQTLHRALAAAGVETEVGDQKDVPVLPGAQVRLIAAGSAHLIDFKRTETTRYVERGDAVITVTDVRTKEEVHLNFLLEILIGSDQRYRTTSKDFIYAYLAARRSNRSSDNFVLLVRDLLAYATYAGINRGAAAIAQDPPSTFEYPSRHAFEEEMVWLLWRGRASNSTDL